MTISHMARECTAGLKDRAAADALVAEANSVAAAAERAEREVLEIVERKI